jgi:hypothetical protein
LNLLNLLNLLRGDGHWLLLLRQLNHLSLRLRGLSWLLGLRSLRLILWRRQHGSGWSSFRRWSRKGIDDRVR